MLANDSFGLASHATPRASCASTSASKRCTATTYSVLDHCGPQTYRPPPRRAAGPARQAGSQGAPRVQASTSTLRPPCSVLRTPKRACQRHTVMSLIGSDVRCEDHIWMHGSWQAAVPPVMPPKRRVFINSTQQLIILVQMLSLRANCRFQVRAVVVLSLPALGE